jgi:hypothetical protein
MSTGESQNTADFVGEASEGFSRAAAAKFSTKWAGTVDEQQNSQAFWQDFFREVVGIKDLQEAGIEFEKKVISSKKGTTTRIDVYWRETLLVEQKSAGKDLEAAEIQAREYVVSLPPAQRPPVIVICDFVRLRIVDILLNKKHEFLLEELPDNLQHIEAIAKRDAISATAVQVEADQKAARLMANLYLQLEKYGYSGHEASVFMIRVLFCLFADDTRMWSGRLFQKLVEDTNAEGTDLGPRIANLFVLLDSKKDERKGPQDPFMVDFPYVNGGIFAERIEVINFNGPMRAALIDCCNYDWSKINPTIFGALFQDIKSKVERGILGEHYTTEANIEKAIRPLLLDELNEKLEKAWDSESKLRELRRELGSYKIFDPACGCGNFLITSYKRLRQLELDILVRLKQLQGTSGQTSLLDVKEDLYVNLEQLYGIEYVEWSSQIAKVAVYLADHQENLKLESVIGVASNRFPLTHAANIVQGNALKIEWSDVCPITPSTLIVGNPPFQGTRKQDAEKKEDQTRVWGINKGAGTSDYVTNWFILAAKYVDSTGCRSALVSTNSISQGDQPALLWDALAALNVEISFAHRTFAWENDASGNASVHCVIVGLSRVGTTATKKLWDYLDPEGPPSEQVVRNINAYLFEGDATLIHAQKKPIAGWVPLMRSGNKPRDGGYLSSITADEASRIRDTDPIAAKYLRPLVGSAELLNGLNSRFCLWLVDAPAGDLKNSKELSERIGKVRDERASATSSKGAAVNRPSLFESITQPTNEFIVVPSVSSEKRKYIPVDFLQPEVILNNAVFFIESTELWLYAILQSRIFRVWVETVSSRMKSDYQISASAVYNTFPFPALESSLREELETLGAELRTARERHSKVPLGDLYDPLYMPLDLLRIHLAIDKVLIRTFGLKQKSLDSEILSTLFSAHIALLGNGKLL